MKCLLYLSSHFSHLWRNGFLSFNKLLLCYLFLFIIKCEALLTEELLSIFENYILHILTYSRTCRGNLPREFAMAICHENLSWKFAAGICRGYLPWEFAAGICRGFLPFVFVSKSFFVYVSKCCLDESKPFLYVSKTLLFVRFSLLTVFLFVIAVAPMAHRTYLHIKKYSYINLHATNIFSIQIVPTGVCLDHTQNLTVNWIIKQ